MRRHRPAISASCAGVPSVTALCLVTGGWYLFHQPRQTDLSRPVEASVYGERPKHESGDTADHAAPPAADSQEAAGNSGLIRERSSLFNPCRKRRRRQLLLLSTNWLNSRPAPAAGDQETASPQCGKKRQSCRTANYKLLYKKRVIPYAVRVWRNN
mgnify:CR=1 FL=1